MALPLANSFEGGTDNTTVTTGNTGGASGNAFDSITVGGSSVGKFENSQFMHGGLSFEFSTGGVSESSFVSWVASMGTQTTLYGRFYVRLTAAPGSTSSVLSTLSGATVRARLQVTTLGKLRLIDSAAATVWTGTTTLSANTWYRVEFQLTHDTSAGTAQIKLFTGDSTSATEDSGSLTAITFGGTTVDRIRYGCVANQVNFPQTWMDDIQVNGTGFPGPSNTTVSATISSAFTFTAPATAVVKVPATISTAVAFSAPATAVVKVPATVSTAFSFSAPASAVVKVPATVATSFTLGAAATAVVKVPASVSTTFTVSAPAVAVVTVPATVSTSFTFAAPVTAVPDVEAVAVTAFTFAAAATAVVTVPASVTTVLSFAALASATVTSPAVPAVRATSSRTVAAARTSAAAVTAARSSTPVSSAGRSSAPTVSGG